MAAIAIDGRAIGHGHPVYIVAEMSANHGGRLEDAVAIVEAAHAAGADAVKIQTYTADTITLDCDGPLFRIQSGTPWDGRTLHELYAEASLPWAWHADLVAAARRIGITIFSSPFDPSAVDFLEGLGMPAYKIASFELVDIPLLRRAARTGRPLIISTGMATEAEIAEALDAVRGAGNPPVAILKCTSAYPATADQLNLGAIRRLAERFGVPVGLSDHTTGRLAAIASTALGACLIEKHLTLSRARGGPDAAFSLEPGEFRAMVEAVRETEAALGDAIGAVTERERASRVFRKSLFVARPVARGGRLTAENVRCVRPAHGLHPRHLDEVLGRRAARDLKPGTPLGWEDVTPGREGG